MSTTGDQSVSYAVQQALRHAAAIRPPVGGFPVLAEVMHRAGIRRNEWTLPAGQSVYVTDAGAAVQTAPPLVSLMSDVPAFDRDAVIVALRADQAGHSNFPEFLTAIWAAGVIRFVVDLDERTVVYSGIDGAAYTERYPAVEI